MRDSLLLIHTGFRADFFFEVVNSVTCGDQVVLSIKDFLKTLFCINLGKVFGEKKYERRREKDPA